MTITDANAIVTLVRALAGDNRFAGEDAALAIEQLHERAHRTLGAGASRVELAKAAIALDALVEHNRSVSDG